MQEHVGVECGETKVHEGKGEQDECVYTRNVRSWLQTGIVRYASQGPLLSNTRSFIRHLHDSING